METKIRKRVAVFPAGSEVSLEINRALASSTHFQLVGLTSISDASTYEFEEIYELPWLGDGNFLPQLISVIEKQNLELLIPGMDEVGKYFSEVQNYIPCKVLGQSQEAWEVISSKRRTYSHLRGKVPVPKVFERDSVLNFPVFAKPDVGYGSRGARTIYSKGELDEFLAGVGSNKDYVISENLPGEEFTIDCFSSAEGGLLYTNVRTRRRILNGIAANTESLEFPGLLEIAEDISQELTLRGPWFFQMKLNDKHEPVLMEIGGRISGSSAQTRHRGVNLALLGCFQEFQETPLEIVEVSALEPVLQRTLSVRVDPGYRCSNLFIDFDDCLQFQGKLSSRVLSFVVEARNKGIPVAVLSKHPGNLEDALGRFGIRGLFDEVIQIGDADNKSNYIFGDAPLLIDDSHQERTQLNLSGRGVAIAPSEISDLFL